MMKKIIIGILFLASLAGLARVSFAAEGGVRIFTDVDWFLPGNVADGEIASLNKTALVFVVPGGSDAYTITTPAAIGLRLGVLYPIGNRASIGGSVGYIAGPTSEVKFTDFTPGQGTSYFDYNRELSFVRVLGEYKKEYGMGTKWSFLSALGVGMAFGTNKGIVKRATNLFAGDTVESATWSGPTWEGTAGFVYKTGKTDMTYAVRYASFPEFKENVAKNLSKINWGTIGVTLGFTFGGSGDSITSRNTAAPIYKASSYSEQRAESTRQEPAIDLPAPGSVEPTESYENYLEYAEDDFSQKNYAKAAREYDKALNALPENDERGIYIQERKGAAYVRLENYSKANDSYISAIKAAKTLSVTNKTVVNAYLGLAYSLKETGNAKEARANYKIAWKLTSWRNWILSTAANPRYLPDRRVLEKAVLRQAC